jgi:integrase
MLKVARNGLHGIHHDPFADAMEPLITPSDEKKRRRVMSFEEEAALLAQCVDEWKPVKRKDGKRGKMFHRRSHMRIVIIGLVDTLMRGGEFFRLRVSDLDFDPRMLTIQQMNTKTLSERSAPISARFAEELKHWIDSNKVGDDGKLFKFADVKRAWNGIKRDAGVTDLRLKDLRRTGATRLLRRGMPIEEISRILGHTTNDMTYEYIGVDRDTTSRAVELLDAMHAERENVEMVH